MRFSANIAQLRPSATIAVSSLAKRLKSEGRSILDLSTGEPDFDTPEWISDAGVRAIREGQTRYTPAPGTNELRKAIAAEISGRTGTPIDWNGVVVTNGAKQALFNACFALFGPGDDVLIASPYWTSYPEIVTLCRANPVFVAGPESRDFRLTPADLDAAITPSTRGLLLCSPCNPTGAVYPLEELRAIVEWARDRGIVLISDEIYRQVHYDDAGLPAPGIYDLPAGTLGAHVLIDGVSKSVAMTGWRIGFSVSSNEIAAQLSALQSHTTSNAAAPSQAAALAAYQDPERARADGRRMTEAFRKRRDFMASMFREHLPQFPFLMPDGAFYLFFRIDAAFREGEDSASFCSRILEETGVAIVPGVAFGDDRYARLSFATSDEVLVEAVHRLAAAVNPG